MNNFIGILMLIFFSIPLNAQVVINELDTDTPGTDVQEFVELKSTTPNFSLDGYVLVFFNGTNSLSYLAMDLDGLITNVNGLVTIGNNAVSPVPNRYLADNSIQNGPDAVGLYLGNGSNFPTGTLATTTNLITALAHGTSDANATALLTALGLTTQWDENMNAASSTQSIQRKVDGTYEVKIPTPSANNDGTGVALNGFLVTISPAGNLTEGSTFTLTFSTQFAVMSDLNFTFSLQNESFTSDDYAGSEMATIPVGFNSVVKNFVLIDDQYNEGDETMKIVIGSIPTNYVKLNDNVAVRIHDNDYVVQSWGSPLNPTYGLVTNTAPPGYYSSLNGKSGAVLKQAIQDIIANPLVVREHNYGDAYDILKESDQNPLNSSQVWLMYVEQPRSKLDMQTGTSGTGFWNREHIYSQSRGGFTDATSNVPDGIMIWSPTDSNDILAGHSDAHHIRAEDSPENSARGNKNYGVDYNGPTGNSGSWHGDVARAIFYMAVRYNGLNVINGNPSETPVGNIGDLATLLNWNTIDPADDFEMNRNNVIYTWQMNRNPFIDYPALANYLWGSNVGQTWNSSLNSDDFLTSKISIVPNPTKNSVTIAGIESETLIELYSLAGIKLKSVQATKEIHLNLEVATGIYLLKIKSKNGSITKRIVIQ
jgi:hypothetical protein